MKRSIKILPFIALAILAVILSGCDKILEAFFPEETGQGGGQNSVTFRVTVSTTDVKDFWSSEVVVSLKQTGKDDRPMLRSKALYTPEGATEAVVEVPFEYLADGTYQAKTWLDTNGNKQQDADEPAGGLEGGRDVFYLPDGGDRDVTLNMRIYAAIGAGNNSVSVTVHPSTAIQNWNMQNGWVMNLIRLDGPLPDPIKRVTAVPDPGDTYYAKALFEFTSLPDGEYSTEIWLDANGDWYWNQNEPGVRALPAGYYGTFPLPLGGAAQVTMEYWVDPVIAADIPRVAMKGPQIVALGDASTKFYELVVLQTGGPTIESFDWSISGNYSPQGGQIYGSGLNVVFDPGNFTVSGDYQLYIYNVKLSDQQYTNEVVQNVRFITEAPYATQYYPSFECYYLDQEPHYLSSFYPYNVRMEFTNNSGGDPGWAAGRTEDWLGALNGGHFYVYPTYIGPYGNGVLDYMPTYYGVDRVRIYVDTDGNGDYYGADDLATEVELGLDQSDGTFAYYSLLPAQFLRYWEFDILY